MYKAFHNLAQNNRNRSHEMRVKLLYYDFTIVICQTPQKQNKKRLFCVPGARKSNQSF